MKIKISYIESRKILADKIKAIRLSLNLSRPAFGKIAKIHKQVVYKLEHRLVKCINIDDLFRLIQLGLAIDESDFIKAKGNLSLADFERQLNEDRQLMSDFYRWLTVNKEYIEENYACV